MVKRLKNCVKCEHYTEVEDEDGVKGRCKREKHQLSGETPTNTPTNTPTDLISREDAIDAICKAWCYVTYGNCPHVDDGFRCDGCEDIEEIEALPSAEPPYQYSQAYVEQIRAERDFLQDIVNAEPRTGEWIDNHNGTFTCDQCGCKHSRSGFCPNCGADMRGGRK